jgi:sphinganine C4-monooxygenase
MDKKEQPIYTVQIGQTLVAMLVLDTWQYFVHRYMHLNQFLYRKVHSQHHNLVVPYALGALYNHPVEGLLMDTMGGMVAYLVSGMTPRTSIFFFSFSLIKALDQHSGMYMPWNPLNWLFSCTSAHHDVHHQLSGVNCNFSLLQFLGLVGRD